MAQIASGWPQAIDDEWTSHPNFPDGPYSFAQHPPMTAVDNMQIPKLAKMGKKWPNPEYDDSWTPHPNYPSGPYGSADDLQDPTAPGASYPYPAGGYPAERVSSAGDYH